MMNGAYGCSFCTPSPAKRGRIGEGGRYVAITPSPTLSRFAGEGGAGA